jgi:A/G-specific adenine glycosylase
MMSCSPAQKRYFSNALLQWHNISNNRSLPWKGEKDPYKIWLSEIILQQTRALQGQPYYLAFIKKYPTIQKLAAAPDDEVFRLWQGLGYYNRCRNMLFTARYIATQLNGIFPNTHNDLLQLKGIGPYTAAAIGSFAFNLPTAVVDGNVIRVLSRFLGIDEPYDTTSGKKRFTDLAYFLLDDKQSAAYNQAIMDLGATICTPKAANCNNCPLQTKCFAYNANVIYDLPIKAKKLKIKKRIFNFVVFQTQNSIWLQQRGQSDIWAQLYQPYLIESTKILSPNTLLPHIQHYIHTLSSKNIQLAHSNTQKLTHQHIQSAFFIIRLSTPAHLSLEGGKWVKIKDLKKIAFPKSVLSFLEKNIYF